MAQANINSGVLATQIEKQNSQLESAIAGINAANAEIGSLGNVRAEAVIRAAEADSQVQSTAALGKLQAQEAALKAATVIGTNLNDASELITSLGLKARQEYDAAERARDAYFAAKNTSFFDDPLGYIANELFGASDNIANTYNKHAMNFNAATSRLDQIQAQTTAAAQAQNAIAQTITAGSVEALQTQIAQTAVGNAAQVRQQNLLYNINGIEAVMKLNGQQLDNYFKLNQTVMSEKNLAISQANLALSQKNHALQLEARMERIDTKKAERAEIEELGATINEGRASLGLPPVPAGRAIQLMKMGGTAGIALRNQYDIGATRIETGKPIIADNPGRAARVIADTQAPLNPAAKPIKEMLLSSLSDTVNNNKKIDKKDVAQVDRATTDLVKGRAQLMATNINPADGSNIYQAPDMKAIATIPAIKEHPLYAKVLAPSVESGNIPGTNPQIIINMAVAAVGNRQITMNEAIDGVTKIFRGAVAINNENKDFLRYSIPPQTNYVTEITAAPGSAFGGNRKVDLTSPVAVSNIMAQRVRDTTSMRAQAASDPKVLDTPANRRY